MHSWLRLRKKPLSVALVGLGLAVGCGSFDASSGGGVLGGPGNGDAGVIIGLDAHASEAGPKEPSINPLCVGASFCGGMSHLPDDPQACANFDAGGAVGTGGAPGVADGGRDGAASEDAASPIDASADAPSEASREAGAGALDAGVSDASEVVEASRDAAADGSTPAPAPTAGNGGAPSRGAPTSPPYPYGNGFDVDAGPLFSCQVVSDDSGLPVRQCMPAGHGSVGAPCAASSDCRAGLACVGTEGAGQCRPYCCDPRTKCEPEPSDREGGVTIATYCGERPLLDGSGKAKGLSVPVCVPPSSCRLDEKYPCTSGCTCPDGLACAIVGDGQTSCVKPGTGKLGEGCPCAPGYFCSHKMSSCVKLCKTSETDVSCAPGQCQAAAGFPDGWGLCVGLTPAVQ